MKIKVFKRTISVLLCSLIIAGLLVPLTAGAAVLPDDYEDNYASYQDLGILEDQYDLIEPINNKFPVISPSSKYDEPVRLYKGTYKQVEKYFEDNGMSDGLPVVPPTKIKAEKFMGYSSYGYNDVVATVNGRQVKAYQVAANAIMAGCSPEHTPICIAFTEALSNAKYLNSLKSGKLTPMMYINGPAAHQINIDNTQGMTTEEANIGIARFMELALINLAGIKRTNAFGNVQPLVFSENDETCLNVGWKPHHVEKGYDLNDNIITATAFSMWGNNVTPATDLPEEIMKVLAWDITEKNLGGLGGASVEDNANTKRLIFITESVASALATKYRSKSDLENALIENARRPLWMRTYAYYYANTGGALTKSFNDVYDELKSSPKEDAKSTASPAWMNGITYANIDTVATMTKGNTDIIVTGDSSRNKTQVMPGGVSVNKEVKLSSRWDSLVQSVNYFPISDFYLSENNTTITPPASVPSVLTNGTYRILDPASGSTYLTRAGRVYFDNSTNTLYYYAQGASAKSSVVLDADANDDFIAYLKNLGYNSSFTVNNRKIIDVTMRFSSNASKLSNNTLALTSESFSGIPLTIHANNTNNSNAAGGLTKDGASIDVSSSVKSFTVNLDGDIVMGNATNADFVKLSGTTATVDPTVEAGATAIIVSKNSDETYRTMTFVNGGDGSYTIKYNTANTLSNVMSTIYLKGTFNEWGATDAFRKTGNSDIVTLTKELAAGTYEFKIYNLSTDEWYGRNSTITDTANRMAMSSNSDCTLNLTGGKYEFKYEISTKKLSVFFADNKAEEEEPEEPQDDAMYLDASYASTANPKWYIWTWGSGSGRAVQGTLDSASGYYKFDDYDTNVIFLRVNPSKTFTGASAEWNETGDNRTIWNKTGDFAVEGNLYTITGWGLDGTWSNYTPPVAAVNYTVEYSYEDGDDETQTITKTVSSVSNKANLIAELGNPSSILKNPYYNYSLGSAKRTGTTVNVRLAKTAREYTVTLNGREIGDYNYLDTATVNSSSDTGFFIDGKLIKTGKNLTIYVTGDIDITTDDSAQHTDTASINLTGSYFSDDKVSFELLATAYVSSFKRMGVAYAASDKSNSALKAAVNAVTSGTAVSNKIAVHNSSVDAANVSGLYQFRYGPYASITNIPSGGATLYFYTFAVTDSGVVISEPQQVNVSNTLA